nr:hypothetical protein GCM10025732_26550 [Glycomyces mayteni]
MRANVTSATARRIRAARPGNGTPSARRTVLCAPSAATANRAAISAGPAGVSTATATSSALCRTAVQACAHRTRPARASSTSSIRACSTAIWCGKRVSRTE